MTPLFSATKYTPGELGALDSLPDELQRAKPRANPKIQQVIEEMLYYLPELATALKAGVYQFQDPRGNTVAVVHRSTQEDRAQNPWQVSLFWPSRSGGVPEPIGHISAPDLKSVIRGLVEENTVKPSTMLSSSLFAGRYSLALHQNRMITSLTLRDLKEAEDRPFLKKDIRRKELSSPILNRVYASTAEYLTKSSKYIQNQTVYVQRVLFKDFAFIARDKEIPFKDAVNYSIEEGDVHLQCSCPSQKWHGFAYISRQLGYLYGLPGPESRIYPEIRNPRTRSVYCKHLSRVVEQIALDESLLIQQFADKYARADELTKGAT